MNCKCNVRSLPSHMCPLGGADLKFLLSARHQLIHCVPEKRQYFVHNFDQSRSEVKASVPGASNKLGESE